MSSLLKLVVRFSQPTSYIFQPVIFFSSITISFDKNLMLSRELVKEILRDKELPSINFKVSLFMKRDVETLKLVKTFLEQYIQPDIHHKELEKQSFDIRKIDKIFDDIWTFILKLYWVVKNAMVITRIYETYTDTLVDDLFHIVRLNTFLLVIRNHQECKLFIGGYLYLSADPEFLIKMILVCGDENMHQARMARDQTIYAVHIISTYVTFYKALIPVPYLIELDKSLPQEQSVVILR
ncbi:6990_t:CDS:2 [Diversispora eburnea]|uniref:6990_t:CDS:1 n=1 Tax=Diversispora eburnea TaxID=1213867 RepID=A0A9N9GEA3_9GLOM|nr:6990_t:CDS:2 [Diversispora eburnea]